MAQHQRKAGRAGTDGSGGNFRWILIAVAVVGVLAIGWAVWNSRGGSAATAPATLDMSDPQAIARSAEPIRKGEPDAPVKIVEFADFQCPGCAHFAANVGRPIREAYVNDGRVQIEYYDFPLVSVHPHAFLAARAARCAGDQERYWEMHDMLYARQTEWAAERTAPIDRFTSYATAVGADPAAFGSCLRSDRHADVVTANAMLGEQLGVRSTPTVYLNGRNVGEAWGDFGRMQQLIEQALGAARNGAPATDSAVAGPTALGPAAR